MDAYEATRIVFSRIQNLDPENASKIMGLLLIQDHGEKEMIRLAFGPEALVHSVILKARKDLGIPSNSPSTPLTPSSPFLPKQNSLSSSSASSRLGLNNLPPPFSPQGLSSGSPSPWAAMAETQNPDEINTQKATGSSLNSSSLPFYGGAGDVMDEFQLQDQLSFLPDTCPTLGCGGDLLFGSSWGSEVHRRSCSVSDVCLSSSDDLNSGFGWKPCLYFARGYCKNGASCRFIHGGGLGESDGAAIVGSASKIDMVEQCHELLRSNSAHQQRLAQTFPSYSPKTMNFLLQQNDTQRAATALMIGEDMNKFGRFSANPASRQIYLTFPADSTFREEDVSNYFSFYGPVQDVRIPYQQKRMFGFVTFVYPETVKLILAKGNPHFVCDARVLVKPYKEKGKVPDKKQQQQVERGEFSPCATPTSLDSRDPYDFQLGGRMFYNTQDLLWRRKLEQEADLQEALELQSRRLMGLQLLDVKKNHHHRALSTGSPVHSPTHSPGTLFTRSLVLPPFHSAPEENCSRPVPAVSVTSAADQQLPQTTNAASGKELTGTMENGKGKESPHSKYSDLQQSLEHNLPDSPFASPKASVEYLSAFSNATTGRETEKDATVSASSCSSLDMASFKSFNCQMPRFSSGAIGMYAGTGGPTCPVGI